MKHYDVVVVGAGSGTSVAFKALSKGLKVALIDKGHVGGTCINVGCLPSKMLIYPADVAVEIREAGKKFGIEAEIRRIDFAAIMERMKRIVAASRKSIKKSIADSKGLDFYHGEARFTDDHILEIRGETISGEKIFLASGSRPAIPPIKGLNRIEYLTNASVLQLKKKPESMIIVGGGYVSMEYAHFFEAMGTKVIVVEIADRLVRGEEPEISALLAKRLSERMAVHLNTEIVEVKKQGAALVALTRNTLNGKETEIIAEKIMVAAGRKSNADLLRVHNTGIETDEANFIKVDDYLQTSSKNIWAFGDATGKQMFTHAAYKEAEIAWHNATGSGRKKKMDFFAVPHAVFTHPQIASVGLTEAEARKGHGVLVGRAKYSDIVAGDTMAEKEGFAKAVVEKKRKKILGFHIIGPQASVLIQEVVNAVANRSRFDAITESMHTFPSLSELIEEALNNVE